MTTKAVVLDTSALMAVIQEEPGAPHVLDLLQEAQKGHKTVFIPFLALMEVEYKLLRRLRLENVVRALSIIESWPVNVVESDVRWRREAAAIKAPGSLSLADAWMAALALLRDAELVHKDPEFDAVPGLRAVQL